MTSQLLTTPALVTLANLDEEQDFTALFEVIEDAKPYAVRAVDLVDDNHKRGFRALEWDVKYVAGHEFDEDGCAPVIERSRVFVKVTAHQPIELIVRDLLSEIKALTD